MSTFNSYYHRMRAEADRQAWNDALRSAKEFTFGVDVARGGDVQVLQVHDKGQVHTFTITDDVRSVSYRGTEIYRR